MGGNIDSQWCGGRRLGGVGREGDGRSEGNGNESAERELTTTPSEMDGKSGKLLAISRPFEGNKFQWNQPTIQGVLCATGWS